MLSIVQYFLIYFPLNFHRYLVRPLLGAIVAMIAATEGSKKDVVSAVRVTQIVVEEKNQQEEWLNVLLEILMKLCDIRESNVSLEPILNQSFSLQDSYKKKTNGKRRLKGPDVGTEEWGNDSGGEDPGSDSEGSEYYSSDSDNEEVNEGEEKNDDCQHCNLTSPK